MRSIIHLFLKMRQTKFIVLFFLFGVLFFQCKETEKEDVKQFSLATVTTTQPTAWDQFSITIQGNVSSSGNDVIIERGFVYGNSQSVSIDSSKITVTSGVGPYTSKVQNLKEKTLYYFKAYAKTSRGIAYGDPVGVSTTYGPIPQVSLTYLDLLNRNTIDKIGYKASLLNQGGTELIDKGLIISTKSNSVLNTPGVAVFYNKSIKDPIIFEDTLSDSLNLPNDTIKIKPNKQYFVKAFARNKAGVGYSAESTIFTSGPGTVLNVKSIIRKPGLVLEAKVSTGGNLPILEQGFLLAPESVQDNGIIPENIGTLGIVKYKNPDIHPDTFSVTIDQLKLVIGGKYKFRSYIRNARGYSLAATSQVRYLPIGEELQNGIIFYVIEEAKADDTKAWIVAKQDLSAAFEYGCLGDTIRNKTSQIKGSATENTSNIIASCSNTNIAARQCRNLPTTSVPTNPKRWDLPTREDLELIYNLIAKTGLGNFNLTSNSVYWSSSEEKETSALGVTFGATARTVVSTRKNVLLKVRAVREIN